MSSQWYVMQSKPNKEDLLWDQLCVREIEVFYPRIRVKPTNPRARKLKPFFPGYLFVNVDLEKIAISSLAWIPGANRMVSFDDKPASVPELVINKINKAIEKINATGGEQRNKFKHGDVVQIMDGPFSGFSGIFDRRLDGNGRVLILLKLLQDKQMRLELQNNMISKEQSQS
jgi:transcription antitermination factor NusG